MLSRILLEMQQRLDVHLGIPFSGIEVYVASNENHDKRHGVRLPRCKHYHTQNRAEVCIPVLGDTRNLRELPIGEM
jgi:hypothetical protein